MAIPEQHYKELCELLLAVETEEELKLILEDLLTPKEIESLAQRWQQAKLLSSGLTQREVAKRLGISISKVTRGSRALQFGSGGYKRMLDKLSRPASV